MSKQQRYKGKFIKYRNLEQKLKFVETMREGKSKKSVPNNAIEKEGPASNLVEGRRIVELKVLGINLKCCKCLRILSLENIEREKHLGLDSILWVKCENCCCVTEVPTGKMHVASNNSRYSDINSKAVLGAVRAGVDRTALNKILTCLDIPEISHTLFKRYEREVGPAIESAAKEVVNKRLKKSTDRL